MYRETLAVKHNQTHEMSSSCSFLGESGETQQRGIASLEVLKRRVEAVLRDMCQW